MPADSWIGGEILGAASQFAVDGAGVAPRCPIGRKEDWEILLPQSRGASVLAFPERPVSHV
jgi:hypothetical protein